MNANDRETFAALIGTAAILYNQQNRANQIVGVYWELLKRYEIADIRAAFERHFKNPDGGQFFPKPADLIRVIDGAPEDRAINAWSLVMQAIKNHGIYESVDFEDDSAHAAIEKMGGWIELCKMKESDEHFKCARFIKLYKSSCFEPTYSRLSYLPGLLESTNRHLSADSSIDVVQVKKGKKVKLRQNLGPCALNFTTKKDRELQSMANMCNNLVNKIKL